MKSSYDLRFGCHVIEPDVKEVVAKALLVEKTGFDVFSFADHLFHRDQTPPYYIDAYVVLSIVGVNTEHIKIMPAVSDVLRRHPATIAHTFSTLDRLTDGRAMLGLGAGEFFNFETLPDIANSNKWKKPVSTLREAVEVIKLLWSSTPENPVSFNGEFFKLKDAFLGLEPVRKPHPPIYIGGYGPRMKKLVVELGDGWIPWMESPRTYQKGLAEMRECAGKLGRSLSIDTAVMVPAWISGEVDKAKQTVRSKLIGSLARRTRLLSDLGYPDLARESVDLWRASTINREHLEKIRRVMRKIPPELVDEFTIVGTPEDAIEKIQEYIDAGVKLLITIPFPESFEETVNVYGKTIIPYFRPKN